MKGINLSLELLILVIVSVIVLILILSITGIIKIQGIEGLKDILNISKWFEFIKK